MKLGIALSGGSLRGAAHIGVLDALYEAGIRPDMIAGASAGSVVASLYAHGIHPKNIAKIALSFPGRRLVDWTTSIWDALFFLANVPLFWSGMRSNFTKLLPLGFIRGQNFERYLDQLFLLPPTIPPTPLFVVAVDLYSTERIIFSDTLLPRYEVPETVFLPMDRKSSCIRASASMPGVFTPCELNGRTLIDGAVRMNIPSDILFQAGCDKVIVVDLLQTEMNIKSGVLKTFFDVFNRSWDIMLNEMTALQLHDAKLYAIKPTVDDVGWTSFEKMAYCIEQGRIAATSALPEIRDYLNKKPTP
ncbi:MAG: patatin-like phospholipase family protein [Tumebacillaceae bacterium]